ncbi:hypothetical protein [Halopseudomonas sp.]|uniref:hypothetical protein n=1 Tax=Halopseudomonas sp. TaxID=2901191 RepID=UPI0030027C72
MQEQARLAYLEAMGVTNWVPRQALSGVPSRQPYSLPVVAEQTAAPVEATPRTVPAAHSALPDIAPPAPAVARAAAVVQQLRAGKMPDVPAPVAQPQAAEVVTPNGPAIEPFYLQLWLSGPCALLTEAPEPGMESATPAFLLLQDILCAAGLPSRPRLLVDFRWPLSRNPQLDRSAAAAHRGLLAFMQGRLEEHECVSLGCFGPATGLLVESDLSAVGQLSGREVALDNLPAAWFAPDLEVLLRSPARKAALWAQLRRVKSRWQGQV